MPEPIYLDHNATTPLAPIALEAMERTWREQIGNPSSPHRVGQRAAVRLRELRDSLLELLGAETSRFPSDRLIFTSGGTEANHLALFGLGRTTPGSLVISAIEHPSVTRSARAAAERFGHELRIAPVDSQGCVDPAAVAPLIDESTRLVSVMAANNETGALQPIAEIAALCRDRAVPCHTDAVQAIGKLPISFRELGVTAMTVAAHKFHGPIGVGGLLLGSDVALRPSMFGGFQQQESRPGTEPVPLIAGMESALRWYLEGRSEFAERLRTMRDTFEHELVAGGAAWGASRPRILAQTSERLPNTSSVAFPGVDRQALVMAADMAGVACATGSACASGSSEPSLTLTAMGLPDDWIAGSVRFSFGVFQPPEIAGDAARLILNAVKYLR